MKYVHRYRGDPGYIAVQQRIIVLDAGHGGKFKADIGC
jgi:N-acetylmuramoyl-L-alanine amidase